MVEGTKAGELGPPAFLDPITIGPFYSNFGCLLSSTSGLSFINDLLAMRE